MATIERKTLLDAMKKVLPGIDKAGFKDNTDSFLFHDGKITTCNSVISVSTPLEMDASTFAVRAQEIYALVNRSNGDTCTIDVDDGKKLKYKCGGFKGSIVLSDHEPLQKVASSVHPGEFKLLPSNFAEAVLGVRLSQFPTGKFKGIATVKIGDRMAMCSCDQDAVSVYNLTAEMDEIYVDDKLLANSLSLGTPMEYSVSGAWLTIRYDSGADFSCKVNDIKSYPKNNLVTYTQRYDEAEGTKVVFPSTLIDAVSRVSVLSFSCDSNGLTSENIQLRLNNEGVNAFARKDGRGEAEEFVKWDGGSVDGDVPEVEFNVPVSFFVDSVKKGGVFRVVRLNPAMRKVTLVTKLGELGYYVNCVATK